VIPMMSSSSGFWRIASGKRDPDRDLNSRYCSWLLSRNEVPVLLCFRCGKEIQVGEMIHVHHACSGFKPLKIYHLSCWEKLFY